MKKQSQKMQENSRRESMKKELGEEFLESWLPRQRRHENKKREQARKACRRFKVSLQDA